MVCEASCNQWLFKVFRGSMEKQTYLETKLWIPIIVRVWADLSLQAKLYAKTDSKHRKQISRILRKAITKDHKVDEQLLIPELCFDIVKVLHIG